MINYSLELWYFTAIILMVGYLKNPTLAVDAISIWLVSLTSLFLNPSFLMIYQNSH